MSEENKQQTNRTGNHDRIIVIGASSGGFEAFKTIVKNLPPDFSTPIFIVWHMSPDVRGVLPFVLNKVNTIYAAHAYNDEPIKPNRIYIAPPDYHMLVQQGRIRVSHGPKENRFRPAVDPLFRSAAYSYGSRVIGIVLSGGLDDGTAGLWTLKQHGGTAIVQDPMDAEVPSMPGNALREVEVDYCVGISEMAELLVNLSKEKIQNTNVMNDKKTKREVDIAAEETVIEKGVFELGQLSPFTCPECHGVLTRITDGDISRYRCHTGHAYSTDTLMAAITEKIEDSLYSAIRGMDESIILLNHIGDHLAEANHPKVAAMYFQKAKEAKKRSQLVRQAALNHEQLNIESLRHEAGEEKTSPPPAEEKGKSLFE